MAISRVRQFAKALRWRAAALRRSLRPESRYASESFSQEGEDLILSHMFAGKRDGFYVDVGAYHPMRFSNTYLFYRMGWRGINIDAVPGSMSAFDATRPRDTNLRLAISDRNETLTLFVFDEPALSTFSQDLASRWERTTSFRVIRKIDVPTLSLAEVLTKHVAAHQPIDLLNVDVEGWDLRVLRSNDWDRFSPFIVVAETLGATLEQAVNSELVTYVRSQGYSLVAKTFNTVFLRRD